VEPDLDVARLLADLDRAGAPIGRPLSIRAETASTNDDARSAALAGAPHGATFLADAQTAGRGRGGHTWHSPPGENLYLSIVLRPELPASEIAPITLVIGLAVARTLEHLLESPLPESHRLESKRIASQTAGETGCPPPAARCASAPPKSPAPPAQGGDRSSVDGGAPRISFATRVALKWPNDVFVDGRKIAGVLVEGQLRGERVASLVAGIGLNVRARAFPPDLAARATSLALAGAVDLDRSRIAASLLAEVGRAVSGYERSRLAPFLPEIRALDFLRGRAIEIGGLRGTGAGIDASGRLLVRDASGAVHGVASGEVTIEGWPADAV
jgi:BirA family biotin operon repressor/biotin-[acetyl-CoA-carboxylase] ligase